MLRRTVVVLAAALMAALSAGVAAAQDYQPGRYDGRNVSGWSYEPALSEKGDPHWAPTDGSSGRDGANCTVGVEPANGSHEQWTATFASLNAESYAALVAGNGVSPEPGNRLETVSVQGRPAIRHFMTFAVEGQRFDSVTLTVSGADSLMAITCVVEAGGMAERLPAFERFLGGLAILTSPAR